MQNSFSRTELLIGSEGMSKLAGSKIAVFGVGGVGSYAAEALARAGVGKLVLVDNDIIGLTNINRQIHATIKTIGQPKVEVMRNRILEINPEAQVEGLQIFLSKECVDEFVRTDYDYVIDAIDTVSCKIELIVQAAQKGIPIISCMGAGNKLDPARLVITDIYKTSVCPLAKVMRRELRKRDIKSLSVVYSPEEPIKPIANEKNKCNNDGCVYSTDYTQGASRRQVPGSISFVPSVAGLLMAGQAVRDLIDL